MSRFNLRQRARISYYEPEEPNLDEYVFCDFCADFVYEYCSIHGPLLVVPDDKIGAKPGFPSYVPRAALTIPHVFLHIAPSTITGAGLGVFTTLTLPRGVRFGPYRGLRTDEVTSMYCWQIHDGSNKRSHVVDARDENKSNWMRYVNCARHWDEQNLVAYQYRGQLYYRTIKIIPRYTELMVFYGSEFANLLHIDLSAYNAPPGYAQKLGAPPPVKQNKQLQPKKHNIEAKTKSVEIINSVNSNVNGANENISKNNLPKDVCCENENSLRSTPAETKNDTNYFECDVCGRKYRAKSFLTEHMKVYIGSEKAYFKCKECDYKTVTKYLLDKHMQYHDSNRKFQCDCCNFRFKNANLLRKHKLRHVSEINCDICEFKCSQKCIMEEHLLKHAGIAPLHLKSSISVEVVKPFFQEDFRVNKKTHSDEKHSCTVCNLKNHMRTHTGEKPYSCTVCNKIFNNNGNLKIHIMRTHTGEKPYSCTVCNKSFTTNGELKIHMRTHTGEKPYTCTVCNKSFTTNGELKIHMRTHTGEKPYSCTVCNKSFNQNGDLKIHMRTHTGEKPYSCTVCNKSFTTNGNLKIHMRTHTGEKPYSCTVCNKSFTTNGELKIHMRTHTGEKPYSCTVCNKSFNQNGDLKIHMRTHTGEKPYSCTVCNKSFTTNGELKIHMRTHTGEKPYSCTVCNKSFNQNGDLKIHMRTHTGEKPYSCTVCNKRFNRSVSLHKHMRSHTNKKL